MAMRNWMTAFFGESLVGGASLGDAKDMPPKEHGSPLYGFRPGSLRPSERFPRKNQRNTPRIWGERRLFVLK